jgi:hypothetical protein
MERRQQRALQQLLAATEEENQIQEQKQAENSHLPAKRKRTEEAIAAPQPLDESTCPKCYESFNPQIMKKHLQKCQAGEQQRDKHLKQTTLQHYKHEQ